MISLRSATLQNKILWCNHWIIEKRITYIPKRVLYGMFKVYSLSIWSLPLHAIFWNNVLNIVNVVIFPRFAISKLINYFMISLFYQNITTLSKARFEGNQLSVTENIATWFSWTRATVCNYSMQLGTHVPACSLERMWHMPHNIILFLSLKNSSSSSSPSELPSTNLFHATSCAPHFLPSFLHTYAPLPCPLFQFPFHFIIFQHSFYAGIRLLAKNNLTIR